MLLPCSACHRHVHEHATACPFCGGPLEERPRPRPILRGATRAALFYFGASLASACGNTTPQQEPVVQPYGAPPEPPDEEPPEEDPEGQPPEEIDEAPPVPLYGGPPRPPEPEPELEAREPETP